MDRLGRVLRLFVIAGFLAAPTQAAPEPGELVVTKAKLRLRDGGRPADSAKLSLRFSPFEVPDAYSPTEDGVTIRLGQKTVLAFPPVDDRARFKARTPWHWTYREKRSRTRVGVLDLEARNKPVRIRKN